MIEKSCLEATQNVSRVNLKYDDVSRCHKSSKKRVHTSIDLHLRLIVRWFCLCWMLDCVRRRKLCLHISQDFNFVLIVKLSIQCNWREKRAFWRWKIVWSMTKLRCGGVLMRWETLWDFLHPLFMRWFCGKKNIAKTLMIFLSFYFRNENRFQSFYVLLVWWWQHFRERKKVLRVEKAALRYENYCNHLNSARIRRHLALLVLSEASSIEKMYNLKENSLECFKISWKTVGKTVFQVENSLKHFWIL